MGREEFPRRMNKRGGPNKWGGKNFHEELINGKVLIRTSRVEKSYKINKQACPFIRHLRVLASALGTGSLNLTSSQHIIILKNVDL